MKHSAIRIALLLLSSWTMGAPGEEPREVVMPVWKDLHAAVPSAACTELHALFSKYYPKGVYTNRVLNGIKFEYNITTYELPPLTGKGKHESRRQPGPMPDGILCFVYLQQGSYKGQLILIPLGNGQHSEYVIDRIDYKQLLMAPYSSAIDAHLWTSLSYPPGTSDDFLLEYRAVMTRFSNNELVDTQQGGGHVR